MDAQLIFDNINLNNCVNTLIVASMAFIGSIILKQLSKTKVKHEGKLSKMLIDSTDRNLVMGSKAFLIITLISIGFAIYHFIKYLKEI